MNYAAYASMWKAQVIPSDGIGRIDAGNVVMSKWEIEEAERIQLPLRTDQDALIQMFYLRRNVLKTKIDIPGQNNFYAVNIHATAFATDDTKQRHIDKFRDCSLFNLISTNFGDVAYPLSHFILKWDPNID